MAVNIATLAVKFIADTFGLKTGAKDVAKSLQGVGDVGSALTGKMSGLVSSLVTGAAAFYGIYKAQQAFVRGAGDIDKMSKIADRLGLSLKSIQAQELSASLAGMPLEQLTHAFDRMSKSIGSGGMSLEKRFLQQAKAIAAIEDPAQQAAMAMKIFGKSGADLLPLLKSGGKAFEDATHLIERFDLALTDTQGQNVERMNDSWTKLGYIIKGVTNKIVAEMAPAMGAFLDHTIEQMADLGGYLKEFGLDWDWVGLQMSRFFAELANLGEYLKFVTASLESAGHMMKAIGHEGNRSLLGFLLNDDENDPARQNADSEWAKAEEARKRGFQSFLDFWNDVPGTKIRDEAESRRLGAGDKSRKLFDPSESRLSPGALRDSVEAARIINQSVAGSSISPEAKAAMETAKNTSATRAAVETMAKAFSAGLPVLALGSA